MRARLILGGTFLSIFALAMTYAVWKVQKSNERAQAASEWIERCKRLKLTETRDEVLQRMGQPTKEAVVADGRTVLMFPHWAVSDKFPRVYFHTQRQRVDHIVCTESQTARMTPQLWADWDRYQTYLYNKEKQSQSRALLGPDAPSP